MPSPSSIIIAAAVFSVSAFVHVDAASSTAAAPVAPSATVATPAPPTTVPTSGPAANPYPGNCGAEQSTFDLCVDNLLVDGSQVSYASVEAFCAPQQANKAAYYQCLCERYNRLVQCFTNNCATDTVNIVSYQHSQSADCGVAAQLAPTSTVPVVQSPSFTPVTGGPVLTMPGSGSNPAASTGDAAGAGVTAGVWTAATTSKSGAVEGVVKVGVAGVAVLAAWVAFAF
ncbi:hypothetical protein HK101_004671 [Irineochytrium annulatum]|nr:hypothetical protein HK101_004671 [Irineochytrium annulatum]